MVINFAESPVHEVASMASTLRNRLFLKLRKELGCLCFSGMILLVSSCAETQPVRSASSNLPYLALMRTNLSALPEARLTGSLYVENGCVLFKLYGGTAGSTAVFDNRSRFVPLPGGFAIDRPQGRLLGGRVYTMGGGAADRQLPLVSPLPANCPQSLVLLGTAQPMRSQSK